MKFAPRKVLRKMKKGIIDFAHWWDWEDIFYLFLLLISIGIVVCLIVGAVMTARGEPKKNVHVQVTGQSEPSHFVDVQVTETRNTDTITLKSKDGSKITVREGWVIFEGDTCPICGERVKEEDKNKDKKGGR